MSLQEENKQLKDTIEFQKKVIEAATQAIEALAAAVSELKDTIAQLQRPVVVQEPSQCDPWKTYPPKWTTSYPSYPSTTITCKAITDSNRNHCRRTRIPNYKQRITHLELATIKRHEAGALINNSLKKRKNAYETYKQLAEENATP